MFYYEKREALASQCIDELHKTFITPFDREDIYQLSLCLDDVLDYVHTTVEEIQVLNVNRTPELPELSGHSLTVGEAFTLALPAGSYRFVDAENSLSGGMERQSAPLDAQFEVTPGETVYIGRLLLYVRSVVVAAAAAVAHAPNPAPAPPPGRTAAAEPGRACVFRGSESLRARCSSGPRCRGTFRLSRSSASPSA